MVAFRCRHFLLAVFTALSLGSPVAADADFERNARGMTLSDMIGRTMVGVTRDGSSVFSVFLGRDGRAEFHNANGNRTSGSWSLDGRPIVCFTGLDPKKPRDKTCKRAAENGRGLDWMTVNLKQENGKTTWSRVVKDEQRGSSQMVYSFAGKIGVDQNSYVGDVTKWAGHLIVGRTLKDREAWFAQLGLDGRLDFVFASGKRFAGKYTLKPGEVCLEFPTNPELSGCRKPTLKKTEGLSGGATKIIWASSKDGAASSELVYMKKLEAEGPREMAVLAEKGHSAPSLAPNAGLFVTYAAGPRELSFWHADSGREIGRITQMDQVRDIAFSPDSHRVAVLHRAGVEVFDTRTGGLLAALEQPPGVRDFAQVALVPMTTHLIVGHENGVLTRYDLSTGAVLTDPPRSPLMNGRFQNLLVSSAGHFGVVQDRFVFGVLGADLLASPERSIQHGNDSAGMAFSADGRYLVGVSKGPGGLDTLRLHVLDATGIVPPRTLTLPINRDWKLQSALAGDRLLLNAGEVFAYVSLPDLKVEDEWAVKATVKGPVVPVLGGAGVAFINGSGRLVYWGRDRATALRFGTDASNRSSPARVAHQLLNSIFSEGRTAADSAELTAFRAAEAEFNKGNCADYARLRPTLRLKDRRMGCEAAAATRATVAAFSAAISANDCGAADRLASQVPNSAARVKACRTRLQRAADERAFAAAREAGDCTTVHALAANFNDQGAGPDCDLAQALKADSPRRLYLAAVQFDTAGDRPRARTLYTEVMTRFPDDDLALDAANRLTALADMVTMEQRAADQATEATRLAKQQSAAIKAAEDRARAAEAAARKANDEAEKQRKAAAEQSRRADQARRDAEAARSAAQGQAEAQRQQQAQQQANTCSHLYSGKVVYLDTGNNNIWGQRMYDEGVIMGVGRSTATFRDKSDGSLTERSCSSF